MWLGTEQSWSGGKQLAASEFRKGWRWGGTGPYAEHNEAKSRRPLGTMGMGMKGITQLDVGSA